MILTQETIQQKQLMFKSKFLNYIKYQSLLRSYFKTRKTYFNPTSFVYYPSRKEAKCENYH